MTSAGFDSFVASAEPRLRRAFVARYGLEAGIEACAEAVVYAWQHWDRLREMSNPTGYLFRVGQTAARTQTMSARTVSLPSEDVAEPHTPDTDLPAALACLSRDERSAVLLVHAHGYSYSEAAEVLDIRVTTLRNHLHRGMKHLRQQLGERT